MVRAVETCNRCRELELVCLAFCQQCHTADDRGQYRVCAACRALGFTDWSGLRRVRPCSRSCAQRYCRYSGATIVNVRMHIASDVQCSRSLQTWMARMWFRSTAFETTWLRSRILSHSFTT